MNSQKLEKVTSFMYLGATPYKDGTCSAEIRITIASAMAAMARFKRILLCKINSFASKFKLYKSLVTSILLYGWLGAEPANLPRGSTETSSGNCQGTET